MDRIAKILFLQNVCIEVSILFTVTYTISILPYSLATSFCVWQRCRTHNLWTPNHPLHIQQYLLLLKR